MDAQLTKIPVIGILALGAALLSHSLFIEQKDAESKPAYSQANATAEVSVTGPPSENHAPTGAEIAASEQLNNNPLYRYGGMENGQLGNTIGSPSNTADDAKDLSNSEKPLNPAARQRKSSATFIARSDLPPEMQQPVHQALESYNRNGYLVTNELHVEQLSTLQNAIVPIELNTPFLKVELQDIENSKLSDLKYIGAIPDNRAEGKSASIRGIRRVFEHEAGLISLYESRIGNSKALLQKEFVNQTVKDYPASQLTYCAPSNRCITQLTFLTKEKQYELSFSGDIEELGDNHLVTIASSFDLPPVVLNDEDRAVE